jgi:hypothetical protein
MVKRKVRFSVIVNNWRSYIKGPHDYDILSHQIHIKLSIILVILQLKINKRKYM